MFAVDLLCVVALSVQQDGVRGPFPLCVFPISLCRSPPPFREPHGSQDLLSITAWS